MNKSQFVDDLTKCKQVEEAAKTTVLAGDGTFPRFQFRKAFEEMEKNQKPLNARQMLKYHY